MKGIELLENNPLSATLIREWFLEKMLESLDTASVPDDFKEMMRSAGIENDKIATLIDVNPRMLLDVFDNNDIIIVIGFHANIGFTWHVDDISHQLGYNTRKEAEISAIITEFGILEQQLTSKEINNEN
jgi:hypothetical protein